DVSYSTYILFCLFSQNFSTQFSRVLSSSLSTDLSNAYRESLQRVFVPALEKNLQRLFDELNVVFRAGTQQYLDGVSKHSQASSLDPSALSTMLCARLLPEIKTIIDTIPVKAAPGPKSVHANLITESSESTIDRTNDLNKAVNVPHPQASTMNNDRTQPESNVVEPIPPTASARSFWTVDRGTNSQPSNAPSVPAPSTVQKATALSKKEEFARLSGQAQTLIRSNRLPEALELALISTNQALVLDVCSDIDPSQLFGLGRPPIGQNVLLSLIHQLSCGDLNVQLNLKLRYLEEAVLSLNKRDSTTIEHGPRIISLLNRRLDSFLASSGAGTVKMSPAVRSRVVRLNQLAKSAIDTGAAGK
ncbi:hypothetical protein PHET_09374, partial [Paragonimus heterotremus]